MESPPSPPPSESLEAEAFSSQSSSSADFSDAGSALSALDARLQDSINAGNLDSFPVGDIQVNVDPASFVVEVEQPTAVPCVPSCEVTTLF